MLNQDDKYELDQFLSHHRDEEKRSIKVPVGTCLGAWRVEALLGRGGSGEVYRVVHSVNKMVAAAKVLVKDEPTARRRFADEQRFVSNCALPQFPRFYDSGESNGLAFVVFELLEPLELPKDDEGVAKYLLSVCACVAALHHSGFIHRDIKPKNIMRRANGEVVLIDFGLAKDAIESPNPRRDVSIVSERVVGVGTPEYAAPEQLTGGNVSPLADIHALGRIANVAFGGNPPRAWNGIIRRSTSSIPSQRFKSIEDFACAIRTRHRSHHLMVCGLVVLCFSAIFAVLSAYWQNGAGEAYAWNSLCNVVQTNVITRQLLWERLETNNLGMVFCNERAYRNVTNNVNVTLVCLNRGTRVFRRPIRLEDEHEYWIVGPGTLDAVIVSSGGETTVRLKDCVLLNRSTTSIRDAGIKYVFQGGAYLNFTSLDRGEGLSNEYFIDFDRAYNEIRFKGPEGIDGLNKVREGEQRKSIEREGAVLEREKIFDFSREFLPSRCEYMVESMKKKDKELREEDARFGFYLDPNRVRTPAEVSTFAKVFSISKEEARRIIERSGYRCST